MSDFEEFLSEQFALWGEGKDVSPEPPPTGSLDASTCEMFMESLDPISGNIRMGPEATFAFGASKSNQPKKSGYALFSVNSKGKVVLHYRYIYLVAAHRVLLRELGWPAPRVRFYDGPYALVAYDARDRPYVIGEARDTEGQANGVITKIRSGAKSETREGRLLDGIRRDKPKLFWMRGPEVDKAFEIHGEEPIDLRPLAALPSWEELGNP